MISQTIINEMQDCSIEMGISIVTLVENHSQMEAIATKAATSCPLFMRSSPTTVNTSHTQRVLAGAQISPLVKTEHNLLLRTLVSIRTQS